MNKFKGLIFGFICFFLTIAVSVIMGIAVYSKLENEDWYIIVIAILCLVIFTAALCSFIDYIRRKVMIEKPLNEILRATDLMSKGNFNIRLSTNHIYNDYDGFDLIKDALNSINEKLMKNEIINNDFIANFSHEIKTPVSVIQNYAKLLGSKTLKEEDRKKYINNLKNACNRLTNLVTSILKLNKLENQKVTPIFESFNISEILINVILQYENKLEEKTINLECDIEEDLFINSEKNYIEIVFSNLINNAIKFTDEGEINISLKKNYNEYIFRISDTGCGMDAETGDRIFDKFYQGDTSHSSEGNGLGLTLVKKVINILGGSISVESEKNVGTIFTVVIKE